jgi:hypothetical protein
VFSAVKNSSSVNERIITDSSDDEFDNGKCWATRMCMPRGRRWANKDGKLLISNGEWMMHRMSDASDFEMTWSLYLGRHDMYTYCCSSALIICWQGDIQEVTLHSHVLSKMNPCDWLCWTSCCFLADLIKNVKYVAGMNTRNINRI